MMSDDGGDERGDAVSNPWLHCFTVTTVGREDRKKCNLPRCSHKGFSISTSSGNLKAHLQKKHKQTARQYGLLPPLSSRPVNEPSAAVPAPSIPSVSLSSFSLSSLPQPSHPSPLFSSPFTSSSASSAFIPSSSSSSPYIPSSSSLPFLHPSSSSSSSSDHLRLPSAVAIHVELEDSLLSGRPALPFSASGPRLGDLEASVQRSVDRRDTVASVAKRQKTSAIASTAAADASKKHKSLRNQMKIDNVFNPTDPEAFQQDFRTVWATLFAVHSLPLRLMDSELMLNSLTLYRNDKTAVAPDRKRLRRDIHTVATTMRTTVVS